MDVFEVINTTRAMRRLKPDPVSSLDDLEERFLAWSRARHDIRAAIVVGSRARTDHPADEWADLDVGFLTTRPKAYLESAAWIEEIAPVWTWYADPEGVTRHVLFEGGFDAGFAPAPVASIKTAIRLIPILRSFPILLRLVPGGGRISRQVGSVGDYYRRGVRVILDKDGIAAKFLALFPASHPQPVLPGEGEFAAVVREFWFAAVWTAKHLRRGELWWTKTAGSDGRMKSLLLRMVEWHAVAQHGRDYDTWQDGRFLEEWADPRVVAQLPRAFARYDSNDIAASLLATMDVFRWLAIETAGLTGQPYPATTDRVVTKWVTRCLSEAVD